MWPDAFLCLPIGRVWHQLTRASRCSCFCSDSTGLTLVGAQRLQLKLTYFLFSCGFSLLPHQASFEHVEVLFTWSAIWEHDVLRRNLNWCFGVLSRVNALDLSFFSLAWPSTLCLSVCLVPVGSSLSVFLTFQVPLSTVTSVSGVYRTAMRTAWM